MDYRKVQTIAKETIEYIREVIKPGMALSTIKDLCENYMYAKGITSFWYYEIGAFIFSGKDTTLSMSGRDYEVPDKLVQENDIITIDLSPQYGNRWGDYSRTLIMQDGAIVNRLSEIRTAEWRDGLQMEEFLHNILLSTATTNMTFEELAMKMNEFIHEHGYENLDYHGNLGHSIQKRLENRIYLEKGNTVKLSEVSMFTFEPHIRKPNSMYGYKKEDIYYFDGALLKKL